MLADACFVTLGALNNSDMEVDFENPLELSDVHTSSVGAKVLSINDDFEGCMLGTDTEVHVLPESILSEENFMIAMKLGETRLGFELRPEQLANSPPLDYKR